eukprot:403365880
MQGGGGTNVGGHDLGNSTYLYNNQSNLFNSNAHLHPIQLHQNAFHNTTSRDLIGASMLYRSQVDNEDQQSYYNTVLSNNHQAFNNSTVRLNSVLENSMGQDTTTNNGTALNQSRFQQQNSFMMQESMNLPQKDKNKTTDKKQLKREEFEKYREQIVKRNNHLFVKDYSKNDYSLFFFDEQHKVQKVSVLIQQREFLVELLNSNQSKIDKIKRRIQSVQKPQTLVTIGNKEYISQSEQQLNSLEKLLIEIKYAVFDEAFSKKQKPMIRIGQPSSSVPEVINQIITQSDLDNQLRYNILNESQQNNTKLMKYIQRISKSKHIKRNSQMPEPQFDKSFLKRTQIMVEPDAQQNQFINSAGNDNQQQYLMTANFEIDVDESYLRPNLQQKSGINTERNRTPKNLQTQKTEVIKRSSQNIPTSSDLYFTTHDENLEEQMKKEKLYIKRRKQTDEKIMITFYEAFVMYYEKQTTSQDKKSFSIEVFIKDQMTKNKIIIGKKQNFMNYQFMNGQIFEKEIILSNNMNESYVKQQKQDSTSNQACRVYIKIQYLQDEVQKLEDCIYDLDLRQEQLNIQIESIDNILMRQKQRQGRKLSNQRDYQVQPHQYGLNQSEILIPSPPKNSKKGVFDFSTVSKAVIDKNIQNTSETPSSKMPTTCTNSKQQNQVHNIFKNFNGLRTTTNLEENQSESNHAESYQMIHEGQSDFQSSQKAKYYYDKQPMFMMSSRDINQGHRFNTNTKASLLKPQNLKISIDDEDADQQNDNNSQQNMLFKDEDSQYLQDQSILQTLNFDNLDKNCDSLRLIKPNRLQFEIDKNINYHQTENIQDNDDFPESKLFENSRGVTLTE